MPAFVGPEGSADRVLERYAEFVEGYDGGAELATRRPNVFMTRTFSKIYGLGGLRIGWGYGPTEIISAMDRIRLPFNTGVAAQAAAVAALARRARRTSLRDLRTASSVTAQVFTTTAPSTPAASASSFIASVS